MKEALKRFFTVLSCSFFIISCTDSKDTTVKILVSETKGLDRGLEYVTTEIPVLASIESSQLLVAKNQDTGEQVPVQVLDTVQKSEKLFLKILFPVDVLANTSTIFALQWMNNIAEQDDSGLYLSDDAAAIENEVYRATFSTEDDKRGGQINGILLRKFEDRLLKRTHIAMHWAPNFSKSNAEGYYNMEDLKPSSKHEVEQGLYTVSKLRSGITDSVPEIFVEGEYTFLADQPYFIFESIMTVEKEVSLKLLRNDEMTMDSLFTHVAYQKKDGTLARLELYTSELDSLDTEPIPHDAGFVAFYNRNYGYGLASIRLAYDNTNVEGQTSPLYNNHTKISRASNNGRYWNRVLIDSVTTVPKGSAYQEKNAYLIFEMGKEIPEEQILFHAERLWNPLTVTLQ
jgi:hypothetical protein